MTATRSWTGRQVVSALRKKFSRFRAAQTATLRVWRFGLLTDTRHSVFHVKQTRCTKGSSSAQISLPGCTTTFDTTASTNLQIAVAGTSQFHPNADIPSMCPLRSIQANERPSPIQGQGQSPTRFSGSASTCFSSHY